MVNALFVNSGLLGQRIFARFVQRSLVERPDGVRATQIVLTEEMTPLDRAIRRVMCQRLWPERTHVRNLDLFRYRAEWHSGVLARRRIRRLERTGERFDVLHFHRQATAYASISRIRRTPTIVSIDCTQGCFSESAHPLEAYSYRPGIARDGEVFRAARLIIATSEWAARSVQAEYPGCRTPLVVMATPIDLACFDEGWIAERYDRAEQPGYRPRVLFVGGDFIRKGGPELLDVWRDGGFGARASLEIVTDAPIDETRLPDGVAVRHGIRPYTAAWIECWRRADVFVLPTRQEAFGTAFQDAAAAGLPAIGTRIMAVPELIEDNETGYLVPSGDAGALARRLTCLLDSPALRRTFGTRARAHVARTADPDAYRRRLVTAMHDIAGRQP